MFVLFVVSGAGALVAARAAHSRSSSKSKIPERHSGDAGAIPADRSTVFNTAGASLRSSVSKTLRARGSTETPCIFILGRSIIQEVTRLASGRARCKAVAVHHFKSREG